MYSLSILPLLRHHTLGSLGLEASARLYSHVLVLISSPEPVNTFMEPINGLVLGGHCSRLWLIKASRHPICTFLFTHRHAADHVFFQALSLFPHVNIYANAVNDPTVPFITSAVEAVDPFRSHETNGIQM